METHHQVMFAIIIGVAVISFWRGVWELQGLYLFPTNHELSLWSSVFIGVGILILTNYLTKEFGVNKKNSSR
ncbi:hypothetical protein HYT57_00900 [Candidatus Woesearchaeota archaeon]|nr:hypothetical protein [Candidatus Woesearchaeota archaeon]